MRLASHTKRRVWKWFRENSRQLRACVSPLLPCQRRIRMSKQRCRSSLMDLEIKRISWDHEKRRRDDEMKMRTDGRKDRKGTRSSFAAKPSWLTLGVLQDREYLENSAWKLEIHTPRTSVLGVTESAKVPCYYAMLRASHRQDICWNEESHV